MGKIVETAPADIVVLITGKFVSRTIDLDIVKKSILSQVAQKLEWAFCNRGKIGRKIIIDVFIFSDREIAASAEISRVKIKILVKNDLKDFVKGCEKQVGEYFEQCEWFSGSVKFQYQEGGLSESMCFSV